MQFLLTKLSNLMNRKNQRVLKNIKTYLIQSQLKSVPTQELGSQPQQSASHALPVQIAVLGSLAQHSFLYCAVASTAPVSDRIQNSRYIALNCEALARFPESGGTT